MAKVIDHLTEKIRGAVTHDPDVQVAPACILWPDKEKQWESAISKIKEFMPELLILGDYAPENHTGPAIWLRCVLANCIEGIKLFDDRVPIIYLPGIGGDDIRSIEKCPDNIKPLAELQFRGMIWSQKNGNDWTVPTFLGSKSKGLELDIHQIRYKKTNQAIISALMPFLDEDFSLIQGKKLDREYFNNLLMGGDPVRNILAWLDDSEKFKADMDENKWRCFVEHCNSNLKFDPENHGILAGLANFARHSGAWQAIWERYCEAPNHYKNIPEQLKKCASPVDDLMWHTGDSIFEGWPQWNEEQEKRLYKELISLADIHPQKARDMIIDLEKIHGHRRDMVWAKLGYSPLSLALGHLVTVAKITKKGLNAGSIEDIEKKYSKDGWQADYAVIRALACAKDPETVKAVTVAIRSIYSPWLEESSLYLQDIISKNGYIGGDHKDSVNNQYRSGDCILFVDGLRFDIAKILALKLGEKGLAITENIAWAALPSITATGKSATAPVREKIIGYENSVDFVPSVLETGQAFNGGDILKKMLKEAGWLFIENYDSGDGQGMAWTESGNIDQEGHKNGCKLVKNLDEIISQISNRIHDLLSVGWKRIFVITDHGWLLMPGGLPKIELHKDLVDSRWGRCASIKSGAKTDERLYPWFWNKNHFFALAPGISCYKKGLEYTHGGLSLQECLNLFLTVEVGESSIIGVVPKIKSIIWKGLRCTISVEDDIPGLFFDIRSFSGNAKSSLANEPKPLKENGTGTLLIVDDDKIRENAFVVLTDANGSLIAEMATIIGG